MIQTLLLSTEMFLNLLNHWMDKVCFSYRQFYIGLSVVRLSYPHTYILLYIYRSPQLFWFCTFMILYMVAYREVWIWHIFCLSFLRHRKKKVKTGLQNQTRPTTNQPKERRFLAFYPQENIYLLLFIINVVISFTYVAFDYGSCDQR